MRFTSLVPFAAAVVVVGQPERLAFAPKEGSVVELRFQVTATSEVLEESWCPIVDGERDEEEAGTNEADDVSSFDVSGTLVDTYVAVSDGRVTELVREFSEIGGAYEWSFESENEYEDDEAELSTPLSGRGVRFVWDADRGEYGASFEDEEEGEERDEALDALLLTDQRADAFGAWFLPGKAVEVGDEWELSVDAWSEFVQFGGELWVDRYDDEFELTEEYAEAQRDEVQQARDNAEGSVRCTFEEVLDEDGVALAVIAIEVDLETRSALESLDEDEEGRELAVVTTIEDSTKARGTCVWDLAAGAARSIEFEATILDTTVVLETDEADGVVYAYEWKTVSETEATLKLEFERR